MRAYSLDLRHRILEALQNGATRQETGQRFCVSLATVKRYKRQWQAHQSLEPKPIPGRPALIKAEQHQEFAELVASRSDWTLEALGEAWQHITGIKPTVSVLSDTCQRLKITRKKRVDFPENETRKNELLTSRS